MKLIKTANLKNTFEFLEDMAVAKEAEEEYDRQGLAGTTFYAEYRAKRLGSESTV